MPAPPCGPCGSRAPAPRQIVSASQRREARCSDQRALGPAALCDSTAVLADARRRSRRGCGARTCRSGAACRRSSPAVARGVGAALCTLQRARRGGAGAGALGLAERGGAGPLRAWALERCGAASRPTRLTDCGCRCRAESTADVPPAAGERRWGLRETGRGFACLLASKCGDLGFGGVGNAACRAIGAQEANHGSSDSSMARGRRECPQQFTASSRSSRRAGSGEGPSPPQSALLGSAQEQQRPAGRSRCVGNIAGRHSNPWIGAALRLRAGQDLPLPGALLPLAHRPRAARMQSAMPGMMPGPSPRRWAMSPWPLAAARERCSGPLPRLPARCAGGSHGGGAQDVQL